MNRVLGRRKAYLGILVALGLLLGLMPAGLVQGQVEPLTHGGTDVYIDDVNFVTGTPFTTVIHVDGVVGGGPITGLASFEFDVAYSTAAVTFPGAPSCGVTGIDPDFTAPFVLACDTGAGTIVIIDVTTDQPAPSGNLSLIQLDGETSCANSSQTLLALTLADVRDPDGNPLPDLIITDGVVTCWVAPIASFTSTPDPADAGDTINFTDTSQSMTLLGGAGTQQATWLWDFGDGVGTSSLQDPTYSYNVPNTYNVCLTTTNPAGTDAVCQSVVVEPGPATTATVSPSSVIIDPGDSLTFTAEFEDSLGNVIPNTSMDSLVWSAGAGGTIDSVTGLYTAGVIVNTYLNDVCVDGTYKSGMVMDCADVLIAFTLAQTGMFMAQDPLDGVVVIEKWILDTVDALGNSKPVTNGIAGYVDELSYPGSSLMEVKEVRPGDFPFDSSPTPNIQNDLGTTNLTAVQTATTLNQAPQLMARVALILNSCTDQSVTLDDTFTQITDGDGEFILEQAPSAKTFLRGDIRNDGLINIADVLFGAQYLVGLRDIDPDGGDLTLVHPVNMASVKHDGTAGDKKNIADVLFIAQQLGGLRDQCFEIV